MQSLSVLAGAAFLAACAGPPLIEIGPDPADPAAPVPPVRYAPVTAGVRAHEPVEPKPWPATNEQVAPGGPGAGR